MLIRYIKYLVPAMVGAVRGVSTVVHRHKIEVPGLSEEEIIKLVVNLGAEYIKSTAPYNANVHVSREFNIEFHKSGQIAVTSVDLGMIKFCNGEFEKMLSLTGCSAPQEVS